MVHWLADKGKLKLDENVANIWPEFGTNGKDQIKVYHVLNQTFGLHNALAGVCEDPKLFCDYEECVKRIAMAAPETEPVREQFYHYFSSGWLWGGIIEFQDVLEEAFVRPLNIEGEFYIGIPPGVESRLATFTTIGTNELITFSQQLETAAFSPSSFNVGVVSSILKIFGTPNVRRAIVPSGNGHCSARAVARYYAALVDGGVVPPLEKNADHSINTKIFTNSKEKIHDDFLGSGVYKDLIFLDGLFGLGFRRVISTDGSVIGFGHAGLGGSTGYCDINNRFAVSVTLNKLSLGGFTGEIIHFLCSELDLPVREDYSGTRKREIKQ